MGEEKKLFKTGKKVEDEQKPLRGKWFVYLTYIYLKLNTLIMWFTIIFNGILIAYMIVDFNVGIILFLFNQYIVIAYYMKLRKERQQKKKDEIEVI